MMETKGISETLVFSSTCQKIHCPLWNSKVYYHACSRALATGHHIDPEESSQCFHAFGERFYDAVQ
jgi:hypothetical protein